MTTLLLLLPLQVIAEPYIQPSYPVDTPVLSLEKPITEENVSSSLLCNCWAYVTHKYPLLHTTGDVLNHLSSSGEVAAFYYPNSGLYHYALVLYETGDHYVIDETNFHHCQHSLRTISKHDPNLLGFFHSPA